VVNSQFVGNSAARGGAIYASAAALSIVNSAFRANAARTTGGAVYTADASSLTLLNTTFSANSAGERADQRWHGHSHTTEYKITCSHPAI
jgi:predicted outer membrane repeat protein